MRFTPSEVYEMKDKIHILRDGVYFSEEEPKDYLYGDEIELNEGDYVLMPYETDRIIILKTEPTRITKYRGQGNYGTALVIPTDKKGYIIASFEND